MDENIDGNLFILTGVGQLRNITGFINQYNATNNIAIVLYTVKNLDVVNNIEKLIDTSKFLKVEYIKMPIKLLEEKKRKSINIYKILNQVVNQNIEEYKLNNLFLCNFTSYYKFFKKIVKRKLTINLLEEGLTTYRAYLENNDEKNYKITVYDIKKSLKKVLKKLYIIIKPIIVFFKSIIEFCITLLSFIFRKNLIYYAKDGIKKIKKYRYGLISKFDNTYVCYPELMKKVNKNIGNIHKLNFNYTNEEVRFTSDSDKENILFINQKYGVRYKEHFPIIFSILRDMGIKKVYIKFHPKEDINNFKEIFEEAKLLYNDIEIITVDNITHIPVENLINYNKITKIIALTSSSLFYCKLVNKNVEVISIAEEYKKRCEEIEVSKKRMKTFLKDYEMLDRLFNIKQYEYNEEQEKSEGCE